MQAALSSANAGVCDKPNVIAAAIEETASFLENLISDATAFRAASPEFCAQLITAPEDKELWERRRNGRGAEEGANPEAAADMAKARTIFSICIFSAADFFCPAAGEYSSNYKKLFEVQIWLSFLQPKIMFDDVRHLYVMLDQGGGKAGNGGLYFGV